MLGSQVIIFVNIQSRGLHGSPMNILYDEGQSDPRVLYPHAVDCCKNKQKTKDLSMKK